MAFRRTTKVTKKPRRKVGGLTVLKDCLLIMAFLLMIALLFIFGPMFIETLQKDADIIVYKQRRCSCATLWIDEIKRENLTVKVKEFSFLRAIRRKNGVPEQFVACHTAYSNGVFIEGHVPPRYIRKLALEGSAILGIAAIDSTIKAREKHDKITHPNKVIIFDSYGNVIPHHDVLSLLQ